MSQKNFYNIIGPKYTGGKLSYANQNKVNIEIPFRMILVGGSGSGKTNTLLNIIDQMNCFHRFYIFCRNIDQPLYDWLDDKLKEVSKKVDINEEDLFLASNTLDDMPPLETFQRDLHNLIIIDDFVGDSAKNLNKIANIFIRSRTFNASVIFITQSFFEVPKIIRGNIGYILIKRFDDPDDFKLVAKKYFPGKVNNVISVYDKVFSHPGNENFLIFDLKTTDPTKRLRINWNPVKI